MKLRFLFFAIPFVTLSLACGGSSTSASSPTKAPAATAPTAQKADLSKDDLGRAVNVTAPAKRIVAMSPTIVELMYAVGATPVGRPSSADFPAGEDGARLRHQLQPKPRGDRGHEAGPDHRRRDHRRSR